MYFDYLFNNFCNLYSYSKHTVFLKIINTVNVSYTTINFEIKINYYLINVSTGFVKSKARFHINLCKNNSKSITSFKKYFLWNCYVMYLQRSTPSSGGSPTVY